MPRTPSSTQGRPRSRRLVEGRSSTAGRPRSLPLTPLVGVGLLMLLGLWLAASTEMGRLASAYAFVILDFFAGVVVLVALSLSVMVGVFATDRTILQIRHRVMLQAVHRAVSVIAMSFLGVHIAVKVLGGRAGLLDAVVPFASRELTIYVGFGTIASYLLLVAFWTGIARALFAGRGRPWLWRTLHCSAYLCWPVAMMHGLNAGRPGSAWVNVSYVLCAAAVAIALLVRLYVTFGRRPSGVRTGAPAIGAPGVGANTQTIIIPRMGELVASAAGAPALPRGVGPGIGQPMYAVQADAYPGRVDGPPGWAPHQLERAPEPWHGQQPALASAERWDDQPERWDDRGERWDDPRDEWGWAPAPERWEEPPSSDHWDGRSPQRWDGPPAPAGRWDERSAVQYDPREYEPEPPRRVLRLVDDVPPEPPFEAAPTDPSYGWAGPERAGWEQQAWEQQGRDHYSEPYYEPGYEPGYRSPAPYPPALAAGAPASRGGREQPDRRRRGRWVS